MATPRPRDGERKAKESIKAAAGRPVSGLSMGRTSGGASRARSTRNSCRERERERERERGRRRRRGRGRGRGRGRKRERKREWEREGGRRGGTGGKERASGRGSERGRVARVTSESRPSHVRVTPPLYHGWSTGLPRRRPPLLVRRVRCCVTGCGRGPLLTLHCKPLLTLH